MNGHLPDSMKSLSNVPDSLSYHLAHPEGAFDAYYRKKKLEHAQGLAAKKKIYLDQKFWIYCRNVEMGRPKREAIYEDIYYVLMSLVSSGVVICPASHLILEETIKQSDPNTRLATGAVIDKLSGNVALESIPFLDCLEWFFFFKNMCASESMDATSVRDHFAWTWSTWMLGTRVPYTTAWDEARNTAIQKAFFDSCTHLTFSDTLKSCQGPSPNKSLLETDEFVAGIRKNNTKYKADVEDFRRALLIEAVETVKVHLARGTIEEAIIQECCSRTGRRPTKEEVLKNTEMVFEWVCRVCRKGIADPEGSALPCIHILAGIHAKERNNDHKWETGDAYDSLHARGALPYCDYFLTEKALGNLLVRPPLRFDQLYDCRVMWKNEEILEALKGLLLNSSEDVL